MNSVKFVDIPKIADPRGNLSFMQNGGQVPFDIAQVEWIYQTVAGAARDPHAFFTCRQMVVALSGSCEVEVNDPAGDNPDRTTTLKLNNPARALLIEPTVWRRFVNFSTNCVLLVLSSTLSGDTDRITDYRLFLEIANENS